MNLADVYGIRVPRKERRRVGRGRGSGLGKTSGRGEKGQGTRSGTVFRLRFEGGQMPLYRRLRKKGFSNHPFRLRFEGVNVSALERAFPAGSTVDLDTLRGALLVPKSAKLWKLLGGGELTKALTVKCDAVSEGGRTKVEKAGGRLELVPGAIRERLESVGLRRVKTSTARTARVEEMRQEAQKLGKPKKAAATGKQKKPAGGGGRPAGGGKPAAGGATKKDQASKKDQA